MTVHYASDLVTVLHGDCLDELRTLPDASVHAIVTDPPYGIAFMGKQWDQPGEFGSGRPNPHGGTAGPREGIAMEAGRYDLSPTAMRNFQRWVEAWAAECLRVLKPGGHLLAFGGSRTWHRLAGGIEDAGFEIRDSIAWLYGSGFPKSLDVSKAIDAAAGAERSVVATSSTVRTAASLRGAADGGARGMVTNPEGQRATTAPATEEARQWEGWGTALKPSFEPIVVARKPFAGTVAANVLEHGTGALNIKACRVGDEVRLNSAAANKPGGAAYEMSAKGMPDAEGREASGRWPSNVLLDGDQADALDAASGTLKSGMMRAGQQKAGKASGILGEFKPQPTVNDTYGDEGGASRFFPVFRWQAKAPTSERPVVDGVAHPTVKPLALMQWLVRLVTPPGGTVLEPFAGSGTTIEAAIREGFDVIGIEREADYLPLIMSRVRKDHAQSLFGDLFDEDGAA